METEKGRETDGQLTDGAERLETGVATNIFDKIKKRTSPSRTGVVKVSFNEANESSKFRSVTLNSDEKFLERVSIGGIHLGINYLVLNKMKRYE